MVSFVKALRSEEAKFFDTHPLANHVLNVIARRARRTPCERTGLQVGECFVGHKGLGLSEQQYRTVKKNLQKWNLVEFKKAGRLTDQGTVAKLLNSSVYDINETDPNGSLTEDQRKDNGRATEDQRQTKNVIMEEGKNKENTSSSTKADPIPYQQIVNSYNDNLPTLRRCIKVTDKVKLTIRKTWNADKRHQEFSFWDRYFKAIPRLSNRLEYWSGVDGGNKHGIDLVARKEIFERTVEELVNLQR